MTSKTYGQMIAEWFFMVTFMIALSAVITGATWLEYRWKNDYARSIIDASVASCSQGVVQALKK